MPLGQKNKSALLDVGVKTVGITNECTDRDGLSGGLANYAIIGIALVYFQFRKNKPGFISSIFKPLIGQKGVKGPIGKTIDILAVFAADVKLYLAHQE